MEYFVGSSKFLQVGHDYILLYIVGPRCVSFPLTVGMGICKNLINSREQNQNLLSRGAISHVGKFAPTMEKSA